MQEQIDELKMRLREAEEKLNGNQNGQFLKYQGVSQEEKAIFERKKAQPLNMWNMDLDRVHEIEQKSLMVKQKSIQSLPALGPMEMLTHFLSHFQGPMFINI